MFSKYRRIFLFIWPLLVQGQPESYYDPFDWVMYRETGAIISLTEGNEYVYIGTAQGGVWRFNIYSHNFDEPLTTAQGLPSNSITAVHHDQYTNLLWVATPGKLCYSLTEEGEWQCNGFNQLDLPAGSRIEQMGSDENYLWCKTQSLYLKCDRYTGGLISSMVNPDTDAIKWSSAVLESNIDSTDLLSRFNIFGAWNIFSSGLLDPQGEFYQVTTLYSTRYGNTWVGTDQGFVFRSEEQMQTLEPYSIGLTTTDIEFILPYRGLWVSGRHDKIDQSGISHIDDSRAVYENILFRNEINMSPQALYSGLVVGHELWFGGNGQVLVYNVRGDFWRTFNEADGVPPGQIRSLAVDSNKVWLGSTRGLGCISLRTKNRVRLRFEPMFSEQTINDIAVLENRVWIAADNFLFVYDNKQDSLIDYRQFDRNITYRPEFDTYRGFNRLIADDNKITIGTETGIVSYNQKLEQWKLVLSPTYYHGNSIRALAGQKEFLWLADNQFLFRIEPETGILRQYDYDFMGIVNDLYINSDEIWIGTSEGLVKFNWQADL